MNPHSMFNLYWVSQTLITAVRLGFFDRLALGPQTAAQVAQALNLNPDATRRLLQALTAMGLVLQAGATYANTPLSTASLVSSSPTYIGGIAFQHAEQLWPLWEHLPTAVREGRPVLREAFGGDRNPFDVMTSSPEQIVKLIGGMDAGAKGTWEYIAAAHDFSRNRRIMDVGGGSGVVTGPLLQRYPHLSAVLFDLPQVVAVIGPFYNRFGVGERLAAHGGDFFDPTSFPPNCDVAVISRVLHDWSDEKALAILRNVHAALAPGGVVLVLENLLDTTSPTGRMFAALSDLMMLVMTDGGRERTGAEYEALIRQAGFRNGGTHRSGGALAVIKGQKG